MAGQDIIVVGSGAAGLSAACTAAALGKSVLLLEATDRIGGTTATSGGMMWIPGTQKARAAGSTDSRADVETYLGHFFDTSDPRLQAFLDHGDSALTFLERHTTLRTAPVPRYPDYRAGLDGATTSGRVLEPEDFDGASLGQDFRLLREPLPEMTLFGGMMVSRTDLPILRKADRSPRAALHAAKLVAAYGRDRLRWHRGTKLVLGNALVARLFKSARDLGVDIRLNSPVARLVQDAGRITGVVLSHGNEVLSAPLGVILATGGVSHHPEIRRRYVPARAGHLSATFDAGTGGGVALAQALGARVSQPGQQVDTARALWVPVSRRMRADGSEGLFPHTVSDRGKPGVIAVNADGQRFTNEAVSYHDFVRAQLDPDNRALPAWLICDRTFLWRYGLGSVLPFSLSTRAARRAGYLHRGRDIPELARRIGLPPDALSQTVRRWNAAAEDGRDPDFDRGSDAYQRHMGDADHQPNPCVAPIRKGPFHAIALHPADLGMAAGLVTDARARVLGPDNQPLSGLHAVGNDMESVFQGSYPGPGITIGPAIVFGVLAARDACGADNAASA